MKPSVLKSFVTDWSGMQGIEPEMLRADVWSLKVPKALQERLGRPELLLAFNQRVMSKYPRSELATVGNPVFDRLLGVAREEGRIGIAYAKPHAPPRRAPSAEKIGDIDGIAPSKGIPIYQGIYHLVFTITYPSIEAADEMEIVSVDGGTLEVLAQTPDLAILWHKLEQEPRKGRTVINPLPIPDLVFDSGLKALDRRMRRRINRVRATSEERLEAETKSIEGYYQQLIEEARNQSRRWTTKTNDRDDRIRWLQLEWKRRIEEATEFWRPQVNARLVGAGIQMIPRVGYLYPVGKPKKRGPAPGPMRVWDEATRRLLPPYCEETGEPGLEDPTISQDGRFLRRPRASSGTEGDNGRPAKKS